MCVAGAWEILQGFLAYRTAGTLQAAQRVTPACRNQPIIRLHTFSAGWSFSGGNLSLSDSTLQKRIVSSECHSSDVVVMSSGSGIMCDVSGMKF